MHIIPRMASVLNVFFAKGFIFLFGYFRCKANFLEATCQVFFQKNLCRIFYVANILRVDQQKAVYNSLHYIESNNFVTECPQIFESCC